VRKPFILKVTLGRRSLSGGSGGNLRDVTKVTADSEIGTWGGRDMEICPRERHGGYHLVVQWVQGGPVGLGRARKKSYGGEADNPSLKKSGHFFQQRGGFI